MGLCTAQYKLVLFRAKTIAFSKKKKIFGRFSAFWFNAFTMLFSASKGYVGHENH